METRLEINGLQCENPIDRFHLYFRKLLEKMKEVSLVLWEVFLKYSVCHHWAHGVPTHFIIVSWMSVLDHVPAVALAFLCHMDRTILLLTAPKMSGLSQSVDLWLNCWSSQCELHWLFIIFNVLISQVHLIEINFWNKVFLGIIRTDIINLRTQLAFTKYLLCAKYYSRQFTGIDLLRSQWFPE